MGSRGGARRLVILVLMVVPYCFEGLLNDIKCQFFPGLVHQIMVHWSSGWGMITSGFTGLSYHMFSS